MSVSTKKKLRSSSFSSSSQEDACNINTSIKSEGSADVDNVMKKLLELLSSAQSNSEKWKQIGSIISSIPSSIPTLEKIINESDTLSSLMPVATSKSKRIPSKKTSLSQWQRLPTVLLDIIFTNLNDNKYLLLTIELVCKGWQIASKSGNYNVFVFLW